jgi:type II secretory pathway component PulK
MKPVSLKRRRATLVITVLACLALVMLLMTAWLKVLGIERRALRSQQDRVQAEYLAASGVARAVSRLTADPSYTGETFTASAEELASAAPGAVTIRVEAAADDPQARLIGVSARVPATGSTPAQRSRQHRMQLTSKEPSP